MLSLELSNGLTLSPRGHYILQMGEPFAQRGHLKLLTGVPFEAVIVLRRANRDDPQFLYVATL